MNAKPTYADLLAKVTAYEKRISELDRRRRSHQKSTNLLTAIRKAQSQYIIGGDPARIYKLLLQALVEASESEYGFLDEVVRDENGDLFKKNLAISDISWDEHSRALYRRLQDRDLKFTYLDNLSGLPALSGKTVISNDPSADSRSRGLPMGHPAVKSFLGMPVYFGGRLICVAGVANKAGGYIPEDAAFLEPLLMTCGSITYALQKDAVEKENQRRLVSSEAKYRLIVENQDELVVKLDNRSRLLFASPSYCRTFDIGEKALTGKSFFSLIHADDVDTVKTSLQRIKAPPHTAFHEERARTVDGWRWFGWSFKAVLDEKGDITEIVAVGRDITDRKQAEELLKKSEDRYRALFFNSPLGMFRSTFEGRFLEVNPALAKMLGYDSPDEVLKSIYSIGKQIYVRSEKREDIVAEQVLSDGVTRHVNHYRRRDGSPFIANLSLKTIFDDADKPAFLEGIIEDITERRSAEKALKESEGKLRAMFNASPLAMLLIDRNGTILDSNEEHAKRLRKTRDEILGKCVWDLLPESVRNGRRRAVDSVFRTGRPVSGEDRREGIWNEYHIHPALKNDRNAVEAVIVEALDITKRKETEAQLRESEALLNRSQETAALGSFVWDLRDDSLSWSRNMYIIHGLDQDTFAGNLSKVAEQLIHPDDLPRVQGEIRKMIAAGRVSDMEFRIVRPDGRERIMRSSGEFELNRDGIPVKCFGIHQDITDQKRAELEIRQSEARFRDLSEMLPEAIFEADLDMNLTFINQQAYTMFGYTKKDFERGLNGYDMLLPEDKQRARENGQKRLRGEDRGANEYRGLKKDGTAFPVLFHTSPIVENGVVVGIRGIIVDLTERKKLEARMIESQKMESIGALAGGIAHDFNNILFPIVGMAELLTEDLPKDSLECENAREILKAGKRGSDLVKQILAFSRQSEHRMLPVRPWKVVKEALKLARSTIPADINIVQNLDDCGRVSADPTQLHQVVMNLLTNAFHAVEETDGEISIRLSETEIKSEEWMGDTLSPGQYAQLTVCDTGVGIASDIVDKIFNPYFTTKEQGKGTGLGLAAVYGIVKEHGGGIKVDSEIGKGTTFRVYLPLIESDPAAASVEIQEITPTGMERILLVDDEDAVARAEKHMLERLGYAVTAFNGSLEALRAFEADAVAFDLVITDMTMPNMTGEKLARQMLAIRPDIPIIICTGFSERIDAQRAAESGIKGFLMKPVVRSEMAKMVRQLLDESANGT